MFRWRSHLWPCLGLSILTLASLGRVWNYGFISLDDPGYVVDNEKVHEGLTWNTFQWALTTTSGSFWLPVTWLSFLVDSSLYGYSRLDTSPDPLMLGAWGFHITNLALHLVNVLLLYFVLCRLTGSRGRSTLVAALFAVHPLHVESVAWVAERKDVLSMAFFLLAILAYCRYVRRPGWFDYLGLMLLSFLGMAAKPMMVTLPAVLLLLDYWPLGRLDRGQPRPASPYFPGGLPAISVPWAWFEKLPLFGLSLFFSLVTLRCQTEARIPLEFEQRLAGTLAGYWWYLEKTIWPSNLGALYLYYYRYFSSPDIVLSLLMLGAVSVLAWTWEARRPYLIVGWLWFVGTLFPVSGFFQSGPQSYADRFSYLPHIGLFIAVVWGLADVCRACNMRQLIQGVSAATVVVVLAVLSWQQAGYWFDTPTMFLRVTKVTQNNHRAYAILATYYLDRGKLDQANIDEAIYWAKKAVADGKDGSYHFILAMAYFKAENLELARKHADDSLRLNADRVGFVLEAAALYDALGDYGKLAELLKKQLAASPGTSKQYYDLGTAYFFSNQNELAKQALEKSLTLEPNQGELHRRLAEVLEKMGDGEGAPNHRALAEKLGQGTIKRIERRVHAAIGSAP